jgi:hypothetical protein
MASKQKTSTSTGKPEAAFTEYKKIAADYVFDGSIFSEDEKRVAALKYIINNKLNQVDRTIILLYADCQSFRKLGKRLGFSHMTIGKEVRRIKALILDEYKKMQTNGSQKD